MRGTRILPWWQSDGSVHAAFFSGRLPREGQHVSLRRDGIVTVAMGDGELMTEPQTGHRVSSRLLHPGLAQSSERKVVAAVAEIVHVRGESVLFRAGESGIVRFSSGSVPVWKYVVDKFTAG